MEVGNDSPFPEGRVTGIIIGAFYRVYDVLGFGYLESVYRRALVIELRQRGLQVEEEVAIDVWYFGTHIGHFRADLLVERSVICELKASERLTEADRKQLMNYLRGSTMEVGLLLHFGLRAAFQRIVSTADHKARRRKLLGPSP